MYMREANADITTASQNLRNETVSSEQRMLACVSSAYVLLIVVSDSCAIPYLRDAVADVARFKGSIASVALRKRKIVRKGVAASRPLCGS